MEYGSEIMRLAQRAYPEFKLSVIDQVAREQFVHRLQDIEMKWFVDLHCSGGLDEAIRLATQFESFELAEHGADLNRPLEASYMNQLVQIQALSEASSIESLLEKFSTAFEKRMEDLDQKIATFDAKLDAVKAGSKDPVGFSYKGRNCFYQPQDKPRGRLEGSCLDADSMVIISLGLVRIPQGLRLKRGLRNNQLVGQIVLQRLGVISPKGGLIKKGKI